MDAQILVGKNKDELNNLIIKLCIKKGERINNCGRRRKEIKWWTTNQEAETIINTITQ